MKKITSLLLAGLLVGGVSSAFAQTASMSEQAAPVGTPASTQEFMAANSEMTRNMRVNFSGDADMDFIQGMIPHHQGAVEMAKIELKYGKNPKARAFAQKIINDQATQIAQMTKWLSEHKTMHEKK
ncbi:DUF305 domain-containing protein [Aristophania vespae]|uniref:DUF305 domain-containing protein n=1 Tax=Aristophania vespae TaxID=2697033 RepID=A0A6P1NHH2_9PROT|nr:DUF305 domain-containing protein [Aristophania vespae]QHI95980.1 DUF305 domain-containing protein [Aristophania vespae]UMM63736.1 hypothetical protein DM15PD_07120 [Aristophania vespae]